MKKNIFKFIIITFSVFIVLIIYLSLVGIETEKFNNQIKDRIIKANNNIDINLKKIKLTLDPINFKINAKTVGTTIFYSKKPLSLEYIKTQISLVSLIKNKIISSNIEIVTRSILLKDLVRFIRASNNTAQLFFLEKIINNGFISLDIKLNFDELGNIKNDYEVNGFLQDGKINFLKKNNFENISFNFNLKKDNYKFKEIKFTNNKIDFISKLLNIKKKQNTFFLEGEFENKKAILDINFLNLFQLNLKEIIIEKTNFESKNRFSFEIDNQFKLKNVILNSDIGIDQLQYKKPEFIENYPIDINKTILLKDHKLKLDYNKNKLSVKGSGKIQLDKKFDKIEYSINRNGSNFNFVSKLNIENINFNKHKFLDNFFPKIKKKINFKNHKLKINYKNENLSLSGEGEVIIDKEYDKINYSFSKKDEKFNFDIDLKFDQTNFKIPQLNYQKKDKSISQLKIRGNLEQNKNLSLKYLKIFEDNNKIEISNLLLGENNLIVSLDKANFDYLDADNKQNQFIIQKKDKINYQLNGSIFNANSLIANLLEDNNKNKSKIFKNNINLFVNLDQVYIDEIYFVKNLNGKLFIKKNKVKNANLSANFKNKEKIFFIINTEENGNKITTLTSSWAKPLVNRYKFIKGFEDGYLDFYSSKKDGVSNSLLIIDNFKVKEIPVLARLLALASLQGIADLLTGEGIRFTDFEMRFSNEKKIMTIEELYAIGPAISVLMEGYIQTNELISLRGTLVPATTINRSIASIPLIGDLLIGKKVGEGVFGVSFKIKGPPKNLETKVNPIKTLTPRFITRTLEKLKKN